MAAAEAIHVAGGGAKEFLRRTARFVRQHQQELCAAARPESKSPIASSSPAGDNRNSSTPRNLPCKRICSDIHSHKGENSVYQPASAGVKVPDSPLKRPSDRRQCGWSLGRTPTCPD